MTKLTAEHLRTLLSYDQETGVFLWRKPRPGPRSYANMGNLQAGSYHPSLGYILISVNYKRMYAHRLAWLYVYGELPAGYIDHINCDKTDNRISNLRIATSAQNHANARAKKNNPINLKGVVRMKRKDRDKWAARIQVAGKPIHLGCFDDPLDAHAAYVAAANLYYGEFARAA